MRWNLGLATLSEYDDDDFVGLQVDTLSQGEGMPPFELHHSYGFAARPLDPDEDGLGCTALYALEGTRKGYAWLCNDPRIAAKLPKLRKGESLFYGPKGQFVRHCEDGRIVACTYVDGDPNKFAIFWELSPDKGFELETPWGYLRFGPNGFHVRHSSGARIDLGSIAGLPAPLDALASYVNISAKLVSVEGSAVSQGTDGGATNQAAVTALVTLLGALAAAIDSKNGPTTTTTVAVAAAAAALMQIGKVV